MLCSSIEISCWPLCWLSNADKYAITDSIYYSFVIYRQARFQSSSWVRCIDEINRFAIYPIQAQEEVSDFGNEVKLWRRWWGNSHELHMQERFKRAFFPFLNAHSSFPFPKCHKNNTQKSSQTISSLTPVSFWNMVNWLHAYYIALGESTWASK